MRRKVLLGWAALALVSGCGISTDDDSTSKNANALTGYCDGSVGVRGAVCAVGDSNGRLAVHFNGQWFALSIANGAVALENNVAAAIASVPPVDDPTETLFTSCTCTTRQECLEVCGAATPPRTRVDRRRFQIRVGASSYTVEAKETVYDQRIGASCVEQLDLQRDLVFTVTTNDPVDGNPWTILLTPKRVATSAIPQQTLNDIATEPTTPTRVASPGGMVVNTNVRYGSEVELATAAKTGDYGTPEMAVTSSPALHAAMDSLVGADANVQRYDSPYLTADARSLYRSPTAGNASALFDVQRFSRIFLDTREGRSGWSTPGQDRPTAASSVKELRFRKTLIDQRVSFPFLAGICGLDAGMHAYIDGSFFAGRRSCFDGAFTTVEARGHMALGVGASAGVGCNILVASASAGIEADVRAGVEFETSLSTFPPQIDADVRLYSEVALNAYFRTRVLFWRKKWEASIARSKVFARSIHVAMPATNSDPNMQICDGAAEPDGTCSDPLATCTLDDRCVRYDYPGPSPAPEAPRPVDVGVCNSLVGGRPAGSCLPQVLPLRLKSNGGFSHCTSTLIGARHLLTAAHCVREELGGSMVMRNPTDFFVIDPSNMPISARKTFIHPKYAACRDRPGGIEDAPAYDLAVVELERDVTGIIPAVIDEATPATGDRLTFAGYGTLNLAPDGSKRMAAFRVLRTEDRSGGWLTYHLVSSNAQNVGGDSGGAFFREAGCPGRTVAPHVRAVVSRGFHDLDTNQPATEAASLNGKTSFIDDAKAGIQQTPTACY
ncbi:MAG: trypsin-like serine protease [Deltaproteobacteria bacterium]|nr:trypsin-like serine protease [Deltaproteobacteria bacterium]